MIKINILLVGETSVGKTSLCHRYAKNEYQDNYLSTIGVDYLDKVIDINGKKVYLKIMDTSGQERYAKIVNNLFRQVDGLIFVFDITKKDSFQAINRWITLAEDIKDFPKILVGNKIDLQNRRVIEKDKMENFAKKKNNINCFETSAKTGENVEDAFMHLIRLILPDKISKKSNKANKNITIKENNEKNEAKNCCK